MRRECAAPSVDALQVKHLSTSTHDASPTVLRFQFPERDVSYRPISLDHRNTSQLGACIGLFALLAALGFVVVLVVGSRRARLSGELVSELNPKYPFGSSLVLHSHSSRLLVSKLPREQGRCVAEQASSARLKGRQRAEGR